MGNHLAEPLTTCMASIDARSEDNELNSLRLQMCHLDVQISPAVVTPGGLQLTWQCDTENGDAHGSRTGALLVTQGYQWVQGRRPHGRP